MKKIRQKNKLVELLINAKFQHVAIILIVQFFMSSNILWAQQNLNESKTSKKITGVVTDIKGESIIGATIKVEGTNAGTITDIDGKFSVVAPSNGKITVSYVGFETAIVSLNDKDIFDVKLIEAAKSLDEVVVVGYGTQKKVNLTGAVSAVKVGENLSSRSVSNVTSGLAAMVPGLTAISNSGMAGRNSASLQIRGLGSTNNSSPLVVVDGMPDVDINLLDMNDIESISVLKDASSASIYGSRGANGVVLVTTKTGKGSSKTSINYTGSYGISSPTHFYDVMSNSPRYFYTSILAQEMSNQTSTYKKSNIDEWLAMQFVDPIKFPNENQFDKIFRTGNRQSHNVSASGSSDKLNFYISAGEMDEKGLQLNNDYSRYNARLSVDYKIRKNITVGARMDGSWTNSTWSFDDGLTTYSAGTGGDGNLFSMAPTMLSKNPITGQWGYAMGYGSSTNNRNMFAEFQTIHNLSNTQKFNGNYFGEWEIIKGLKARVDYSLIYSNYFAKKYYEQVPMIDFQTNQTKATLYSWGTTIDNWNNLNYKTQLQGRINYDTELFKGHQLGIMLAASEEHWSDRYLYAQGKTRISNLLTEIDATIPTGVGARNAGGSTSQEGMRSYIGRLNYSINDKYLFEGNIRMDESSRFLPGHQQGIFPSGSFGWRFSEENFFDKFKSVVNSGKLRVSYGSLGNNAGVGRYEQRNSLTSLNYSLNSGLALGFADTKIINENFSWEKTRVANFGLDLSFLNNRLTTEIDYYDRLTTDLIRPSSFSVFMSGYSAPRVNIGSIQNKGVEINLTWRDKIGDFNYSVNLNGSYNQNELLSWSDYLARGTVFVGMPYNYIYTYESAGIAQTYEQMYNAAYQGNVQAPGDVIIKDLNGDGKIDGLDKKVFQQYSGQSPNINFGLNLNIEFHGLELSAVIQGASGYRSYWVSKATASFEANRSTLLNNYHMQTWSYSNRDSNFPRLMTAAYGSNNNAESTQFLQDNTYARLKNLQLSYNLPKKWLKAITFDKVRFFMSAENLYTITSKSFHGIDPEKTVGNDYYPLVSNYAMGVNVTF